MSTGRGVQYTRGIYFEDFCYRTFCDYAVVYVGFRNIR